MGMAPAQQHQVTRKGQKFLHLAGPFDLAGGMSPHTSNPVKIRTAEFEGVGRRTGAGCRGNCIWIWSAPSPSPRHAAAPTRPGRKPSPSRPESPACPARIDGNTWPLRSLPCVPDQSLSGFVTGSPRWKVGEMCSPSRGIGEEGSHEEIDGAGAVLAITGSQSVAGPTVMPVLVCEPARPELNQCPHNETCA